MITWRGCPNLRNKFIHHRRNHKVSMVQSSKTRYHQGNRLATLLCMSTKSGHKAIDSTFGAPYRMQYSVRSTYREFIRSTIYTKRFGPDAVQVLNTRCEIVRQVVRCFNNGVCGGNCTYYVTHFDLICSLFTRYASTAMIIYTIVIQRQKNEGMKMWEMNRDK